MPQYCNSSRLLRINASEIQGDDDTKRTFQGPPLRAESFPEYHDRQWINLVTVQSRTTRSASKIHRYPNACPQAQEQTCHLCPWWFEMHSMQFGVAVIKFPYGSLIISFDSIIVENPDTPLILGLADQLNDTIDIHDGPEIPLVHESNHLWIRWDYRTECLYTHQ